MPASATLPASYTACIPHIATRIALNVRVDDRTQYYGRMKYRIKLVGGDERGDQEKVVEQHFDFALTQSASTTAASTEGKNNVFR